MGLDALPAVIGGHHRLNTGADRAYVPLGMDVAQLTLRSAVVPPVHPVGGTAVADEVLGGRDDMTCVQKRRTAHHTLQSADNATSVGPHDLGVLGVSLVRAPPPVIAHHGHDRGERPIDSGHPTSLAVTVPMRSIRSGSCAAPSPMLWGNSVAPITLLWPWTASVPQM